MWNIKRGIDRVFGHRVVDGDDGNRVIGLRSPIGYVGRLKGEYRTKSGKAYIIECEVDGRERSFQYIKPIGMLKKLGSKYIKVYK